MDQNDLDRLLRRASSTPSGLPEDFATSISSKLGWRESWRDVTFLLAVSTLAAFLIALGLALRPAPPKAPALELFRAYPASHPFDTP
jgi:hypothetical protein